MTIHNSNNYAILMQLYNWQLYYRKIAKRIKPVYHN